MTDHLKPYEKAARIYCAKLGVDPDATTQVPHPIIRGGVVQSPPAWHEAAERLLELSVMLSAMREACEPPRIVQ